MLWYQECKLVVKRTWMIFLPCWCLDKSHVGSMESRLLKFDGGFFRAWNPWDFHRLGWTTWTTEVGTAKKKPYWNLCAPKFHHCMFINSLIDPSVTYCCMRLNAFLLHVHERWYGKFTDFQLCGMPPQKREEKHPLNLTVIWIHLSSLYEE